MLFEPILRSEYSGSRQEAERELIVNDPIVAKLIDRVGAFVLILFFLPLMLLVAAGISFASPGPIFFKQKRIGRGGILFDCYKFRTMVIDADKQIAHLLATDAQRSAGVGARS